MIPFALGLRAASGAFGFLSGLSQARAARQQSQINSYISGTRAIQTQTSANLGLADELATLRATFAANGQGGGSEFFQELRKLRQRQARVAVANERQLGADYRSQGAAQSASAIGRSLEPLATFGTSMFSLAGFNAIQRGPSDSPSPVSGFLRGGR